MDTTDAASRADRAAEERAGADGAADRVVLSYRAPGAGEESADSEWVLQDSTRILDGLRDPSYRRYVGVVHDGPVAVGDEFEEFVNCGCTSPMDVILRVEAVEGGDVIGPGTAIDVVPRRDVLESGAAAIAGAA